MSYIQKNTTLALLFLLLVTVSVMVGFVFYYQKSMTKLNDEIIGQDKELNSMSEEVFSLRANLTNLNELLNLQVVREENLSGQFSTLKDEKDNLSAEKKSLTKKLNETLDAFSESETKATELELDLSIVQSKYDALNETAEDFLDDLEDICDDASSLNITKCSQYN